MKNYLIGESHNQLINLYLNWSIGKLENRSINKLVNLKIK